MDPMFTTVVLGAALMASMSLNPDDEDGAISSSAKSLIAEEKKEVEEVKTAVAVAVAPPKEKKEEKKVVEEVKSAVAVAPAPPQEKIVVEETEADVAVAVAVAVETPPTPTPAPEEVSYESDQKKVTDMLKRVMAEANARRQIEEEAITEPVEEVTLLPKEEVDPWKRYSQIADTQETLAEVVTQETPAELVPEPVTYSPPVAFSPPEVEATNSTPFVVKFVTKIVMPWRKFASI